MKKGTKLLILCVVAFLVIGGYFLLDSLHLSDETDDTAQSVEIVQLDSAAVTSIHVQTDTSDLTLEKDAQSQWYAVGYDSVSLDQTSVTTALDLLCNVQANETLEKDAGSPADFGLDRAQMTLTVTMQDGAEYVYSIGMQNPVTKDYYFAMDGSDETYLVDKAYYDSFADGAVSFALVETLPDLTESSVTDLLVQMRDGSQKHFVYFPDGTNQVYNYSEFWFYDSPVYGLLSMDSVTFNDDYISAVTALALQRPVAIADAQTMTEYGFDDPAVTLSCRYEAYGENGSDGSVRLLISDTCEEENQRYVMLEGGQFIYRMGQSSLSGIWEVRPEDYITPIALPVDLATIESVDIIKGDQTYTVTYEMTQTENEDGSTSTEYTYYYNDEAMDDDTAYAWRVFLNNLRAEHADTINLAPNAFDDSNPEVTVVVHRNDAQYPTLTLSFYKYDASFYISDFNGLRIQLFDKNFISSWIESIQSIFS